jgi:hypothetical protein
VKDRARAIESATLLKDADAMYDSGDKIGVRQLLDGKCADEPEVVWRLARAYYDCAEDKAGSMSKNDKKNLCESALAIITPALEMGPGNYAVHKWYGIILNKVSEFQGTSATIKNSFIVKEHWAKVRTRVCLRQSTAAHRAMGGLVWGWTHARTRKWVRVCQERSR